MIGRQQDFAVGAEKSEGRLAPQPGRRVAYPLSKRVASGICAFWLTVVVVGAAVAMVYTPAIFVVLGAAACLIVSLPLALLRPYDLLSPWSLIVVNVFLGSGIRSIFVASGVDGGRSLDELFLRWRPPEFFVMPGLLYLGGLTLLTIAFVAAGVARPLRPGVMSRLAKREFHSGAGLVVAGAALIGFAAFILYALRTGGLSLDQLSAKRTTITGLDLGDDYSSHGELRLLNGFAAVAFWTQLTVYSSRSLKHGLLTARGGILLLLFVNSCLLPFYASTRSDIVYVVVVAVAIELCFAGRRGSRKLVLGAVLFTLAITPILTVLRLQSAPQVSDTADVSPVAAVLDTFVYARTFTDIPTSSHIISAVPATLPLEKGATVTAWLAAPVPRALWPEKPIISAGPTIGVVVFGNERSGVPPGMIAESYWNFGVAGLLTWPLLIGWAIRSMQERVSVYVGRGPGVALLYSAVVLRVGIDAMSNSVGFAMFSAIQTATLLGVVLWLSTYMPRRSA